MTLDMSYATTKKQEKELKDKADTILAGLQLNESDYRYFLRGSGDFSDIMNGPEHMAHSSSVIANFLIGPKHPLSNVQDGFTISEYDFVNAGNATKVWSD